MAQHRASAVYIPRGAPSTRRVARGTGEALAGLARPARRGAALCLPPRSRERARAHLEHVLRDARQLLDARELRAHERAALGVVPLVQRERARDLSAIIVDVVQKPFTLAEIRTAVAKALAA